MLILSAEDQKKALTMSEAIDAVGFALVEVSAGRAITPIRTALPVQGVEGVSLFMPSLVEAASGLGVKFVSVFPHNKKLGKKTIYGVMVLADVETSEPLALLEASYLTVLRTGAASGLATRYLARQDAKVLGVIGTGAQSRGIISAIQEVRSIEEIRLFNRTPEKARMLADEIMELKGERNRTVRVVDSEEQAVDGADIIVTATNSMSPVFNAEHIGSGVHVNAVGSFRPDMQELPAELFSKKPKVVVESVEAALEETGDLMIPIERGMFSKSKFHAELGELVAGSKMGRENDNELTIFKSVGLAAMDVVVGRAIYDRAVALKLGTRVSF
jgi:ornithine cyclodeaminase